MFQSYTKALDDETWDNFQINCVANGGNKKFQEYMEYYNQHREPINRKYETWEGMYYRRRLCSEARGVYFAEPALKISWLEKASRFHTAAEQWFHTKNEYYQVEKKLTPAASAVKSGFLAVKSKVVKKAETAPVAVAEEGAAA